MISRLGQSHCSCVVPCFGGLLFSGGCPNNRVCLGHESARRRLAPRVCSSPVFGFPLVASDFTSCTHFWLRILSGSCEWSSSPGTVHMTWYILTSCFDCLPPDRLFSAVWLLCFGLHLSSSSLSCRRSVIRSRNFGCLAFGPSTRVRLVGDVCHVDSYLPTV